jgi:pimeloyl-ACP methyl ester carboxylesterase
MPTESSLEPARIEPREAHDYTTAAAMQLHPDRRATMRLARMTLAGLVESAIGRRPLEEVLARAIVTSPNVGRSEREVAAGSAEGEVRVEVGPPSASIALAVIEPISRAPGAALGTVFVLHGIRDRKESTRPWARMLAGAGYRAVLVDLRGHGRSTGDVLSYGVFDAADLSRALDALAERGVALGPIGAMGHSYGAATAIQWAGRDPRVAAVVAVAPFASLRDVVPGYTVVPLPQAFVTRVVDRAGAMGGFDPDAASPLAAVTRTRAPVLVVHGRADGRIPPWHAERIHAAAADHTELVLVDGAGHDEVTGAPGADLGRRAPAWFRATLA